MAHSLGNQSWGYRSLSVGDEDQMNSITRRATLDAPNLRDIWQAFTRIDESINDEFARSAYSLASRLYLAATADGNTGAVGSITDLRLATDRLGGDPTMLVSRRAKFEGLVIGGPNPSLSLTIHSDRYDPGLSVALEISAPQDLADHWYVLFRNLAEARIRELSALAPLVQSTRRRRWPGWLARFDAGPLRHPTWSAVFATLIVLAVTTFVTYLLHLI